jgi:hypothetical protein
MIDANKIEGAIVGALAGDATLAGLLPGGVFWDLAPVGTTAFAIVSLSTSRGTNELADGITSRTFVYLVKAVARGSSSAPTAAADARIQTILDRGSLDLSAAGCSLMVARWIDRIRYTENVSASEIWQHRGGRYEITVTPASS